jgi:hypothetical protein
MLQQACPQRQQVPPPLRIGSDTPRLKIAPHGRQIYLHKNYTSLIHQQFPQFLGYLVLSFAKTYLMSIIKHPLLYVGSKGEKHLYTLLGSGTSLSCINPDLVEGIEIPVSLGKRMKRPPRAFFILPSPHHD